MTEKSSICIVAYLRNIFFLQALIRFLILKILEGFLGHGKSPVFFWNFSHLSLPKHTMQKKDAGPGICSIFMQKSKSFGLWFRFCHRLFRMQHSLRLKLQVKVHSLFVAIFAANFRGKKLEEVDKGKTLAVNYQCRFINLSCIFLAKPLFDTLLEPREDALFAPYWCRWILVSCCGFASKS